MPPPLSLPVFKDVEEEGGSIFVHKKLFKKERSFIK